jgi:hypothetical protein
MRWNSNELRKLRIGTCHTPPMCFYLVVVVGLVCANDPESYVGGRVATGRASQAEQVEG